MPNTAPTKSKAGWLSMITLIKRNARVDDGSLQCLDLDSVRYIRPERHATITISMDVTEDDDTAYCDVQMPLAQGRELL